MKKRTGNPRDGLLAREICYMDESVVERRVDVRNAEHELALRNLRAKLDGRLFLWCLSFLRRLERSKSKRTISTIFQSSRNRPSAIRKFHNPSTAFQNSPSSQASKPSSNISQRPNEIDTNHFDTVLRWILRRRAGELSLIVYHNLTDE